VGERKKQKQKQKQKQSMLRAAMRYLLCFCFFSFPTAGAELGAQGEAGVSGTLSRMDAAT